MVVLSNTIGRQKQFSRQDMVEHGKTFSRSKSMTLPRAEPGRSHAQDHNSLAQSGPLLGRSPKHHHTLPPISGQKRLNSSPSVGTIGSRHSPSGTGGFIFHKNGEDNQLIARYENLRRSALGLGKDMESPNGRLHHTPPAYSPLRRGFLEEIDADIECPVETADWMHSVMASMQKKAGKSLLAPITPTEEVEPSTELSKPSLKAEEPLGNPRESPTLTPRKSQAEELKRSSTTTLMSIDGETQAVIKRFGGDQGYTAADIARLRTTYNRFKVPDAPDVHKDDLMAIIQRLGFMMITEEDVRKLADEVTIYSTLDFNEFVQFVDAYSQHERSKMKTMYDSFDEDNSGQLSAHEVGGLMSAIGFTPLTSMIVEALELVDDDKSGQLSFEEFLFLLAIYRKYEGFHTKEVKALNSYFQQEGADAKGQLPAHRLKDVLLRFYGPQSLKYVEKYSNEAVTGAKKKDSDDDTPPPPLQFHDVLIFARRLREEEIGDYKEEFEKQDKDNSGFIDMKELQGLIGDLGFSLPEKTIEDFAASVDSDVSTDGATVGSKKKDGTLDFDEFVNLMLFLRDTDGFTREEMKEFEATFIRFDDNNSGDVDVLEMGDMMRYMGFLTRLDDVQIMVTKVDFNGSGALDMREFVRLMRLLREKEVSAMREAFHKHKDGSTLPSAKIATALQECQDSESKQGEVNMTLPTADVDFDTFLGVVDQARAVRVAESRKRAGFSTAEVERFKKLFEHFDKDHSGTIDAKEVVSLLQQMGFKMGTREERDKMMDQLDKARSAALENGVKDVGESGQGPVNFWVLIQLLRVLYNRDDKRVLDRETAAAEQSRFSSQEVEEFREVFLSWWAHEKTFEEEPTELDELDLAEPDLKEISKDGMRRLLKSMGIRLTEKDRGELEEHVLEFGDSHHKVDFAAFLRMMRWMMDANFADINKVVSKSK